jgi:hypothetical protein
LSVLAASRFRELHEQQQAALPEEPQPSPPPAEAASKDVPPPPSDDISVAELTRSLQRELERVGCSPGSIDGVWGPQGRQALERFNKHARLGLDALTPTLAALEAVRKQRADVCPKLAFDGTWFVKIGTSTNCRRAVPESHSGFQVRISKGEVSGSGNTKGRVTQNGQLIFQRDSGLSGRRFEVTARLAGESGQGVLHPLGTDCRRTVELTRHRQ